MSLPSVCLRHVAIPATRETLDRDAYNSRRPLDRLTLTLTLTFDLIFIGGRGILMDYLCAKFGDFSFSRFGFIVRTDRQNHRGLGSTLYCVPVITATSLKTFIRL